MADTESTQSNLSGEGVALQSDIRNEHPGSLDSADELYEDLDGVDGSAIYYGTREAFERSGLIPHSLMFPGDMPGMKGARWYGLDRRRYTMSKWNRPPGTFRLYVAPSKAQEVQLRLERERNAKLAKADRALSEANTTESDYRQMAVRATLISRYALEAGLHGPHGWSYQGSVVDAVGELFDQIVDLLRSGSLDRDLTERNRLQAQRAALSDEGLQRFLHRVQK